jgi:hypothetical protein
MLAIGYTLKKQLEVIGDEWYDLDSQGTYAINDSIDYIRVARVYARSKIEFKGRWVIKL